MSEYTDEDRRIMKELGPPPPLPDQFWYHGTTKENLTSIMNDRHFQEGTWFAKHMEDAYCMGGPTVVKVKVSFGSDNWQVCSNNAISTATIVQVFTIKTLKREEEK